MAKIRLKKGQVDPNNPQATSVRGAAKLTVVNIDDVAISSVKTKQQPDLIPGFIKFTREDSTPSYTTLVEKALIQYLPKETVIKKIEIVPTKPRK